MYPEWGTTNQLARVSAASAHRTTRYSLAGDAAGERHLIHVTGVSAARSAGTT